MGGVVGRGGDGGDSTGTEGSGRPVVRRGAGRRGRDLETGEMVGSGTEGEIDGGGREAVGIRIAGAAPSVELPKEETELER